MLISYCIKIIKYFFLRNKLEITDEVQSPIIDKKGVSTIITLLTLVT